MQSSEDDSAARVLLVLLHRPLAPRFSQGCGNWLGRHRHSLNCALLGMVRGDEGSHDIQDGKGKMGGELCLIYVEWLLRERTEARDVV